MRYGIIIGIIVGAIGCGEVTSVDDAGDIGGHGGGAMAGAGGSGGAGACTPDACNTCVDGKKTPVVDGTSCGAGWCGGSAVSPFGGTYATTVLSSVCQAGACTVTQTECSPQSCECGSVGVGYAGCFTDTGPATCKCVNTTGGFCS